MMMNLKQKVNSVTSKFRKEEVPQIMYNICDPPSWIQMQWRHEKCEEKKKVLEKNEAPPNDLVIC